MTAPRISTVQRQGSRFYIHPETRTKAVGVTSVVGMLPKDFLRYWASKVVAETAVDKLGAVVDMVVKGDRSGAIDYLKRAPGRDTSGAADTGDEVHRLVERLASGEKIGRVHPDLDGFVRGYKAFLKRYQPAFHHLEATVWSHRHSYAGSFDALATIHHEDLGPDPVTLIIDNKTTRSGVHAEVAIQLAAYAHADVVLHPDGREEPLPKIDGGAVVWLRPEESNLTPVRIFGALPVSPEEGSEELSPFDVFLALRRVHFWDKELSKVVLGNPLQLT